jgi:hypothetical protein
MLLFSLSLSLSHTHIASMCFFTFSLTISSLSISPMHPLYIFSHYIPPSLYPTLNLLSFHLPFVYLFVHFLFIFLLFLSVYVPFPLSISFPSQSFSCMAPISLPISLSPLFLFLHWLSFAPILVVFNADDNCW